MVVDGVGHEAREMLGRREVVERGLEKATMDDVAARVPGCPPLISPPDSLCARP